MLNAPVSFGKKPWFLPAPGHAKLLFSLSVWQQNVFEDMPWSAQHSGVDLPSSPNLSMPIIQRPRILVQSPAENGQNGPASGCLWFLESSWMSWQTTAASSSQTPAGVGSIPLPAPGLPGTVLPGEWCKSSAMCSYPCLLNGLKTVENREIIFYFNDQKGVAHYSQPTHKMLRFSIFLLSSFSPFGSWPSSSHGFSKKGGKKPKQKTQTPIISISEKQNNRKWGGKDLACKSCRAASVCSSQMFSWQWEKFGFRRASAGCLGCWTLPCKQLQHQNGTFWTGFCSCFYTVRDISRSCCWNQGWQQALYKQFTVTGVYGY